MMGYITRCQQPYWKNKLISWVIQYYRVNMDEAESKQLADYQTFNHFFTRQLRPETRPITSLINGIASPADGVVSQVGYIQAGQLIQAKGKSFTVTQLLGGDSQLAAVFQQGVFATIYLSPKDYHRLHMPLSGQLKHMIHIPGQLFSVNAATTATVPHLFARNERVVCLFQTEIGEMALILVGAIFVSSIETVWHGVVTPPTRPDLQNWYYDQKIVLEKGMEMGRFNMGSTIIILFKSNGINWTQNFAVNQSVKMGELIARY
jgi:phosphatidylserine decarboxylase